MKSIVEVNKSVGVEFKNNVKNGVFDLNLFKMIGVNNVFGFNGGILDGKGNVFLVGIGIGNFVKSGVVFVDFSGVGFDFVFGYV